MLRANANLIPNYRRVARARRRLMHRWIVGVGLYLIALVMVIPLLHLKPTHDDALKLQRAKYHGEIATSETTVGELQAELDEVNIALRATQLVENQSDWSILLNVLAGEMGEGIVLRECSMESQGVTHDGSGPKHIFVDLRGYGQSQLEVSQYVLRLERTGLFTEVTLEESRREGFLESDAIAFRMRCQLASRTEKTS
ncbi:MAG: PilN domain-containing protein [Planctomycetota bacterium]|nr:PilN domain-containing protein [Planctomycetota bacterium]